MEEKKKSGTTVMVIIVAGFVLGSMALGCGASLLLYYYASQVESETEALMRDQREVVKASRSIAAGTILQREHITSETVPERFIPSGTLLVVDLKHFLGKPVSVNVQQGAMLRNSDFR